MKGRIFIHGEDGSVTPAGSIDLLVNGIAVAEVPNDEVEIEGSAGPIQILLTPDAIDAIRGATVRVYRGRVVGRPVAL